MIVLAVYTVELKVERGYNGQLKIRRSVFLCSVWKTQNRCLTCPVVIYDDMLSLQVMTTVFAGSEIVSFFGFISYSSATAKNNHGREQIRAVVIFIKSFLLTYAAPKGKGITAVHAPSSRDSQVDFVQSTCPFQVYQDHSLTTRYPIFCP